MCRAAMAGRTLVIVSGDAASDSTSAPKSVPPRAFAQGVGTVLQFAGVMLFVAMGFVCCASGLLSKETATRPELRAVGWRLGAPAGAPPRYSAQKAMTLSVFGGVFFGLALAGLGLGLQADSVGAAYGALMTTALGTLFWGAQFIFAAQHAGSWLLVGIALLLAAAFLALFGFSLSAAIELRRNPPPRGHDVLPADYKIPYSHYHPDPPEVRLAAELEQRRQRLLVQQKELEALEKKLQSNVRPDEQ